MNLILVAHKITICAGAAGETTENGSENQPQK